MSFSCFHVHWKPAERSRLKALVVLLKFVTHQTRGQVPHKETKLEERKKNENTCGNLPRYLSNQACRFAIFFFNSPYNLFKLHFRRIISLINSGSRQRPLCEVEVWTQRVPLTPWLTLWDWKKNLCKKSIQRNNNFARQKPRFLKITCTKHSWIFVIFHLSDEFSSNGNTPRLSPFIETTPVASFLATQRLDNSSDMS